MLEVVEYEKYRTFLDRRRNDSSRILAITKDQANGSGHEIGYLVVTACRG
jgi:hypothetical protein